MQKGLTTAVTIVQLNKRQFLLPTAVLRKHCPELRESLPETDETMTHLILNGISEAAFEVFSDYFRTGREPDLNIQNVVDVYCAANDLGIVPLKTKCWERVFGNLQREDQALILFVEFGRTSVSPENVHKLMTVITMNFRKIVNSDSFLQLTARQVTQLLTYRPIREEHGIDALFKAGMRWLHADCRGRFAYADLLIKSLGDLSEVSIIHDLPICPTIARATELNTFNLTPVEFKSPFLKLPAVPNLGGGSVQASGNDSSTPPSLESPRNSPKKRSGKTKKKSKKGGAVLKPVFSRITVRKMKYDKIMASEDTESSKPKALGCMAFFPKYAPTKAQYVQTSMTSRSERNLPADRTDTSSLLRKNSKTKSAKGSHKNNLRPGSKKGSKSSKKRSKSSKKKKRSSKSRRNYRLKSPSSGSTRAEREPAKKKSQGKSAPAKKQQPGAKEPEPKVISGAPHPRKAKKFPPPQSETTSSPPEDDRSPILLLSSRPAKKCPTPKSPTSYVKTADEFMRLAHNDPDEGSSKPSEGPGSDPKAAAPPEPDECGAGKNPPKSDTVFRSAAKSETGSIVSSKPSAPNSPPGQGEPNAPGKQGAPKSASMSESNFETKNPPVSPAEEKTGPTTLTDANAKNAAGGRVGCFQRASTINAIPIDTGSSTLIVRSSESAVRDGKPDSTPR